MLVTTTSELDQLLHKYFFNFETLKKIKGGADNEHYLIESSGVKYILRIYNEIQPEKRSREGILEELKFIDFFSSKGIPIPRVIPDQSGEIINAIDQRFSCIFEFFPGDHIYGKIKPIHFAQVGELMAKVHKITLENNLQTTRMCSGPTFWQYVIDRLEKSKVQFSDEEYQIADDLSQHLSVFEKESMHVIHDDYHLGNILFDHDKLSALLDFDNLTSGHFANDISRFFVADLAYTYSHDYFHTQELIDAFFQGYNKIRTLNLDEKTLIKYYINLHFLNQLVRLNEQNPAKILEFREQFKELKQFTDPYLAA